MDPLTITMHIDKTTKNTTRYEEEVAEGDQAVFNTVYIQTAAFNGAAPERIQVIVSDAPDE